MPPADINWCLDREPGSGETLYAAACVAARAAEAAPSPRALDQAFDLLERAWSLGSGPRADEDPDLAVLRRDPRFSRRMAKANRSGRTPRMWPEPQPLLHPSRDTGDQSVREIKMLGLRNPVVRDRRTITDDRVKALSLALHEEFSTPFSFYDGSTGEPLGDGDASGSPAAHRPGVSPEILAIAAEGRPHVSLRSAECFRLVLPIQEADGTTLVAIGDLPALARTAQAARLEQARIQKWLQAVHSRLSFTGGSMMPHRSDPLHAQQLKTLLEGSRELTDLLTSLGASGYRAPIRTASFGEPRPCFARRL